MIQKQKHDDKDKEALDRAFKEKLMAFLTRGEALISSEPKSDTRRPYYNEASAAFVKKVVDELISTKETVVIAKQDYSVNALRVKWYDGWKYLKEHLDKDGFYKAAWTRIACRTADNGLEIYLRRTTRPIGQLLDKPLIIAHPWREQFLNFIENEQAINSKFLREDVALTAEDIIWAETNMVDLRDLYLYSFEPNKILVIRVDKKALGL